MDCKDILVVLELDKGALVGVSLENIAAAKTIAGSGKVIAVTTCENAAKKAIEYGADSAVVLNSDTLAEYNADAMAEAVVQLAKEVNPALIITGATTNGKDIVPRIAAKLGAGSVNDVIAIKADGNAFVFTVPAFSGNILTDMEIGTPTKVISIRGGCFSKNEPETVKTGDISRKDISVAADAIRFHIRERVQEISESVNLEEAQVIVAGGRGMGSTEGFNMLKELADVLGGVVGCTRAAYEAGWISRAHQVGQSGKIVAPKLYLAFGISGATQHVSGMIGSKYIVAVNKDEDAPIFEVADVGIVGNALEVLPIFIDEFKKLKA